MVSETASIRLMRCVLLCKWALEMFIVDILCITSTDTPSIKSKIDAMIEEEAHKARWATRLGHTFFLLTTFLKSGSANRPLSLIESKVRAPYLASHRNEMHYGYFAFGSIAMLHLQDLQDCAVSHLI
jgi:hypothetical protein